MAVHSASLFSSVNSEGALTLALSGRLDAFSTGSVWREAMEAVRRSSPPHIVIDAAELEYLDGAGVSLLLELQLRQFRMNGRFEIVGLKKEFRHLVDLFDPADFTDAHCEECQPVGLPVQLGRGLTALLSDLRALVSFTGELSTALLGALQRPRAMLTDQIRRWISDSGQFSHVVDGGSPLEPGYVLEGSVTAMYGDYQTAGAAEAVLEMQFFLIDVSGREPRILFKREVPERVSIGSENPEVLVRGWNKALTRILTSLESGLREYGSKKSDSQGRVINKYFFPDRSNRPQRQGAKEANFRELHLPFVSS